MNIGIIVYSQTGNTLQIAQRTKDALAAKGHNVTIEQVTAEGEVAADKPVNLICKPEPEKYEAVVFASPVMAFSLNPVMKAYLPHIKDLSGKKAACIVTQALPADWMGGNQAIKFISGLLKSKGADVTATGIVHWSEKKREKQTAEAISVLCGIF